ncbi:hypothetical protein [Lewinella sp. W8]|uniref:hypothetical protein n=1 Tax=Lewinella sp. W8 TaxID=2528208 RepID=UPI0010683ED5|nr:hypothetical protein [Lewinella sp. W8]MTB52514.1 hypothetical protein [Lewinella sp. W8]
MTKNLFLPLLLGASLLIMTGCDDDQAIVTPTPTPPTEGLINFQDPEVGQVNAYQTISYSCGEALPNDRPELRLTVTGVSDTEIEFTETFGNADPVVFTAERRPGNLLISAEDRRATELFFFYGSDSIRLDAPPTATLSQKDCVFFDGAEKFTGDYVAMVPAYSIGDLTFQDLKTVSCVPTILDLDGYLLYNEFTLKASISATSSEFGGQVDRFVRSFVLIEDPE